MTKTSRSIAYSEYGPGDKLPVVFIHAFPLSQAMWEPQTRAFQNSYRLITWDIRGFGESVAGDGQSMLEFFVDDLIDLLDTLKIQKAVLCGLSMGGYIALRAVERNPERVRALVLCDTRSESDSNDAKLKRAAAIKTVKEKGLALFADGFLKAVFTARSHEIHFPGIESSRQIIATNTATGVCGALLAMASRTDTTAALAKIDVPTLIMVGDQDAVTPLADAENLNKGIAGSELHVIPKASHMSNMENPEVFNQHLGAFLRKLSD